MIRGLRVVGHIMVIRGLLVFTRWREDQSSDNGQQACRRPAVRFQHEADV
jgi:hypothetical protein